MKNGKTLALAIIAVALVVVLVVVFVSTTGQTNRGTTASSSTQSQSAASPETNVASLADAKVGDVVRFGSYEQDNNTANGKEAIEWLVIKKEGTKTLLLSKYALDCRPYNTENTGVTWETCSLREWLNDDFYNAAFSSSEKTKIATTTVVTEDNPTHKTDGGSNTRDKVFLLSIYEVNKYFGSNEARMCGPTDFAAAQGAFTSTTITTNGRATCPWWLRSPGLHSHDAAAVCPNGSVYAGGYSVDDDDRGVRPAIWVDMNQFQNALAYQKSINGLISAGIRHTVGLKADGAVVATGYNKDGQCDVDGWRSMMLPKNRT